METRDALRRAEHPAGGGGGYPLVATCPGGVEELLLSEIERFGGKGVAKVCGGVRFSGTLEVAYRACLWSRFASKVLLPLANFPAASPEDVYHGALSFGWQEHFTTKDTFAVEVAAANPAYPNIRFAGLKLKDAVADFFSGRLGARPSVDTDRPGIRLHLFLERDRATISLVLTDRSLHRRGYRQGSGRAPIKENLAAAVVALAGFGPDFPHDAMLVDPFCGVATLLIEAAMIYGDIAPGLFAHGLGSPAWRGHERGPWEELLAEARERRRQGEERPWPEIHGFDADPKTIAQARRTLLRLGFEQRLTLRARELAFLKVPENHASALVVTNPPYGERLEDGETIGFLYQALGERLSAAIPSGEAAILVARPDLASRLDLDLRHKVKLYNGPIPCWLLVGTVKEPLPRTPHPLERFPSWSGNIPFANRLVKNIRKLRPWAVREQVTCLRLYDRDIPEYNLAVDLYENWLHVQEYAPPKNVEPERAAMRLKEALTLLPQVTGIPRGRIFLKRRERQKGSRQYQKRKDSGRLHLVTEAGARLLVNFTDYLDTGLFLDHRGVRDLVARHAQGKRFLNLFAYTGAATVRAAMNVPRGTVSVDASRTYLGWLKKNLAANGLGGPKHRLVRADCLEWLGQAEERFDLILADPPTFSNARKSGRLFDVQRHHQELVRLCMERLEPDGMLIFSTNFRRFKLAATLSSAYSVEETTRMTSSPDFARKPGHRSFVIRHRQEGGRR